MAKVFCVYDSKVEAYGTPFFAQATGAAMRSFADEVNRGGDSNLSAHPEDYTLFELGTWDEQKGLISIYEAKRSLAVGVDLKRDVVSDLKAVK